MCKVPEDWTWEGLDCAWVTLIPYSATTWVLRGGDVQRRSVATHALEDVVYKQLRLAQESEDLRVTTQIIWVCDLARCHTPMEDSGHEV